MGFVTIEINLVPTHYQQKILLKESLPHTRTFQKVGISASFDVVYVRYWSLTRLNCTEVKTHCFICCGIIVMFLKITIDIVDGLEVWGTPGSPGQTFRHLV